MSPAGGGVREADGGGLFGFNSGCDYAALCVLCGCYGLSARFLVVIPFSWASSPGLICYRAVGAPEMRATVDLRAVPFPTAPALRVFSRGIRRFEPRLCR